MLFLCFIVKYWKKKIERSYRDDQLGHRGQNGITYTHISTVSFNKKFWNTVSPWENFRIIGLTHKKKPIIICMTENGHSYPGKLMRNNLYFSTILWFSDIFKGCACLGDNTWWLLVMLFQRETAIRLLWTR